MRVKFKKRKQREFLKKVLENLYCPSLRGLIQRGFDVSYSSLKNYFNEYRTMPKELFENLCIISKTNPKKMEVKYLDDNWGKAKGGKG